MKTVQVHLIISTTLDNRQDMQRSEGWGGGGGGGEGGYFATAATQICMDLTSVLATLSDTIFNLSQAFDG